MNKILLSVLILFLIGLSQAGKAQKAVVGKIKTEIVIPLSVEETESLDFGKLIYVEGGRVTVSPRGERFTTGSLRGFNNDYFGTGRFIITGSPNYMVTVTLPQGTSKLHSTTVSQELTVTDFTTDLPPGGEMIPQASGKLSVAIGATLYIGNQLTNIAGVYYGNYEVVFAYN